MSFAAAVLPSLISGLGSFLGGAQSNEAAEEALALQQEQFDFMKAAVSPFLPGLSASADLMNRLVNNQTTPMTESMMDMAYRAGQQASDQAKNAMAKRGIGGAGVAQTVQGNVRRDTARNAGNTLAQLGANAAQMIPGIVTGQMPALGGMSNLLAQNMMGAGASQGLGTANLFGNLSDLAKAMVGYAATGKSGYGINPYELVQMNPATNTPFNTNLNYTDDDRKRYS